MQNYKYKICSPLNKKVNQLSLLITSQDSDMDEKCAKFVAMFLIVAYVPIGLSLRSIELEMFYFLVGSVSNSGKPLEAWEIVGCSFMELSPQGVSRRFTPPVTKL